MAERELLQKALDALVNARDYVNAEYMARSNLYAAYPHRWATERAGEIGRSDRIRTYDPLVPNQSRN